MKKQLLLIAFSVLALTSCKDDNIQSYELDMLKGDWKTSKVETISGKDNKTVINTEVPSGCSAKNNTFFRTDYYTSYTSYEGKGAACKINSMLEGKYTYDSENKLLDIAYDKDSALKYKVIILSSIELKLIDLSNAHDADGDGVDDLTYITFKR